MIIISAIISWVMVVLLTPQAILLSRKLGVLDHPESRGIHKESIPVLGGVLCSLVFILAVSITYSISPFSFISEGQLILLLSCLMMVTAIGLFDDLHGLKAPLKMLLQAIPVGLVCFWLVNTSLLAIPFLGEFHIHPLLGKAVVFLWLIIIMNSVNIIDGLDGLLSSFAGVYFLSIALMDYFILHTGIYSLGFIASAVTFGFLVHNWPKASIFLGNSGSNFLGFLIALLPVLSNVKTISLLNYTPFIILLGYPIIDSIYAIFRRLAQGKNIFRGDNRHIHHLIFLFGRRKKSYLYVMLALFIMNSGLSFLILLDKSWTLLLAAVCFSLNILIISTYISRRKISRKRAARLKKASSVKANYGEL